MNNLRPLSMTLETYFTAIVLLHGRNCIITLDTVVKKVLNKLKCVYVFPILPQQTPSAFCTEKSYLTSRSSCLRDVRKTAT